MLPVDLLLLGHMAKDEVVIDGVTRQQVGGAVYFGACSALASGASCAVVTKLAAADRELLRPLEARGAEVRWTESRHTCGIRNVYTTADQDRRRCLLLHAGDPFRARELPHDLAPRVVHVGPLLAGQVTEPLLTHLAGRAPLSLDLQGFLRVATERGELELRPWPKAGAVLERISYLKADAAEAEVLTGEADLERAARALSRLAPRAEVVVTHATRLLVTRGAELHAAPLEPEALRGRTGRGDTCIAAYLAARLEGRDLGWATRFAAALTSLKLEQEGPFAGTRELVLRRMGQRSL